MPLQKINFTAPKIRQYIPNYIGPAVQQIFLGGPPLPVLMGGGGSNNGGVVSTLKGLREGSFNVATKASGTETIGKRGRGRPRLAGGNPGAGSNGQRGKNTSATGRVLSKVRRKSVKKEKNKKA